MSFYDCTDDAMVGGVCGDLTGGTCAHTVAYALKTYGGKSGLCKGVQTSHLKIVGGLCVCKCGKATRAHEVGNWAKNNGTEVTEGTAEGMGVYLGHQTNPSNGQGHVLLKINGDVYANGSGELAWPTKWYRL